MSFSGEVIVAGDGDYAVLETTADIVRYIEPYDVAEYEAWLRDGTRIELYVDDRFNTCFRVLACRDLEALERETQHWLGFLKTEPTGASHDAWIDQIIAAQGYAFGRRRR